jgi:pimeloyl-ACP methyl ester carboxylesterase/class 3 adenylate cyclase
VIWRSVEDAVSRRAVKAVIRSSQDGRSERARLEPVLDVMYAQADDGTHVAYRVFDPDPPREAARHIVMVSGGLIPFELFEEEPGFARLLDGLRVLGRVVVFDRRGVGLSDPIENWDRAVADQWTDDLATVVDASGARNIVLLAWDGFGVGSRYAVLHPERVSALVLYEPLIVADDEWAEWSARRLQRSDANTRGEDDILTEVAPSRIADRAFRDWYARAGRMGASPSTAPRIWESVLRAHPRDARLEELVCPTLVLHRRDNSFVPEDVLALARERIQHTTVIELEGCDHFPFVGDVDAIVAEIAAFIGERRLLPPQRLISVVLFTDLVDSTKRAASLGDEGWKSVLDRHDAVVRAIVGRFGGTVIKTTGDGVLALLPSAGVCLRAAIAIRRDLSAEALDVRIGVHVGDIDRRGTDVSGLAVNIASRAMSKGGAGEIVVTTSVVIAVAGQAMTFEPLGTHELKGVPGAWDLFRMTVDA